MAKFFRFPWAITGDRVAIPEPTEGSGAVSYAQGFGPDYEITPGDPGWRPVPRPETNQYLYDITDNLRQYQLFGVPEWYDAASNGGVSISYAINAVVRHNDVIYRSIVATNTVEPGTDATKWATVSVFAAATNAEVQAGVVTDKIVTPAGLSSRTATTTRTGLAALATDVEVQAGVDATKIVTPATLRANAASDTVPGVIELATLAETITGTDSTRAVSPATYRTAGFGGPTYAWSNVAGSRVIGTVYQNTLSRPIMVSVALFDDGDLLVSADNITFVRVATSQANGMTMTTVVPPGQWYKVTGSAIDVWSEMRPSS